MTKREFATVLAGAVLAVLTAGDALAAEAPAATPAPAEAPAAPKRKPKKDAEYILWEKAVAVSEGCGQPIVAFLELKGDKASSKVRMMTVGNPAFKEFVKDNCVYYHVGVPQKEERRSRGRSAKDAVPKPDFDAVKASEKAAVTRINGDTRSPTLPAVAVLAPGGKKVLGTILPTPEDVSFGGFIEELKPLFEKGKCEVVVSKKVQKVIDDEAKRLAAQQKRAGK